MTRYYRKDGTPYPEDGLMEWAKDFGNDVNRVVKQTTLKNGKWVSTVWLGLDHNYGGGRPHIFETMVFPSDNDMGELDQRRYSTEAEALAGHEELCKEQGGSNG
jgi:hypothetical protein